MRQDIPKGWTITKFQDVVVPKKGKKPNHLINEEKKGYLPYLLIDEMEGKPVRNYTDDVKCPVASKNDVLVVWDGSIGKTATGLNGVIGSTIMALTPHIIESKYVESFIKFKKSYIQQTSRGTGLQHINPNTFWKMDFPLAPLNEQKRIVSKLGKLLEKADSCNQRLEKIPIFLKQFRKSVLYLACSGTITKDWRIRNPESQPASKLLKQIQEERMRLYEQECIETKKENKTKPKTPKYCNNPQEHEIDSWVLAPLETVVVTIVDCPHSTPKWTKEGIICIRTTEIKPFNLSLENVRYVNEKTYKERISRLEPKEGDVLYSREGGILGVACQIPANVRLCMGQRMMLIRCFDKWLRGDFLTMLLNSEIIHSKIRELVTGTASPHLNVHDVKSFVIPIPPIQEQEEIVRRVNAFFKIADKIEERFKQAKLSVDKISQSILNKAFHGELVPQDPSDEPASILLERIKKSKEVEIKKVSKKKIRI